MESESDLIVIELRAGPVAGGWAILDETMPNISNYTRVVVDASEAQSLLSPDSHEHNANVARRVGWMLGKVNEVIRGGGRVAVLLPPPQEILLPMPDRQPQPWEWSKFIPGPLQYRPDLGLSLTQCEDSVKRYFQPIKFVDGVVNCPPEVTSKPLATAKFGKPLAVEAHTENGAYVYLPPRPGSPTDAVDVVAEDILEAGPRSTVWPGWIEAVRFGRVQAAAKALTEAKANAAAANERLEEATCEFERAKAPLVVVVEHGLRLQRECERLFRAMGLTTEPVRRDVSDEFMITGGARPILVEVKGREGPARKGDLTQVHTDADNWEEREGKEAKPLLLANTFRLLPLDERETGKDRPFSQWIQNNAPGLGVALMTTWDLLKAYYAAEYSPETGQRLLQAILATSGRVHMEPVIEEPRADSQ